MRLKPHAFAVEEEEYAEENTFFFFVFDFYFVFRKGLLIGEESIRACKGRACKGTDSGRPILEDWGTIRTVGRRRKQDREGETDDICTHTRVWTDAGCAGDAVAPVTGLRPAVVLPTSSR